MSSPDDVGNILGEQNVTINFHNWCLTPQNFTKSEPLTSFWDVLSTNYDTTGIHFISMYLARPAASALGLVADEEYDMCWVHCIL